jgi:DNA-binding NarL/FixJ family response regulator
MARKIRVIVADDSPTALQSVCEYLEFEKSFAIVATASDGQNAVQQALIHRPELALLDLSMPRMNGLEAASQLRQLFPEIKVIIFSELEGLSLPDECVRRGANGFVPKSRLPEALLSEIRRLFSGHPA